MLNWPDVLTAIRASGSDSHPRLNEWRDQMLALAAWFQSQDLDACQAGILMPIMLGLMIGSKARSPVDAMEPIAHIQDVLVVNALTELRRRTDVRS